MGGTKYERVNRRDEDEYGDEDDEGQEVELGTRIGGQNDYGEGSSSLTVSSPSPPVHSKHPNDYRVRAASNSATNRIAMNSILSTAFVILLYFTLSIGLTFYQSSLLEVHYFHLPLSIATFNSPESFSLPLRNSTFP